MGAEGMIPAYIAFGALLINAATCAAFASAPDTFILSTAVLSAVLILTLQRRETHGKQIHAGINAQGRLRTAASAKRVGGSAGRYRP